MKTYKIWSHNPGSKGAKALADALGCKVLKHTNNPPPARLRRVTALINWGSSQFPADYLANEHIQTMNGVGSVRIAQCKLQSFQQFAHAGVNLPDFTNQRHYAEAWFEQRGTVVFCRTILNGSCGRGIVVAERVDQLVDAPLYVKYVPKKDEYRVHVANNTVIDIQRKGLRSGVTDPNYRIRSHDNGFVFVRENVQAPEAVVQQALAAILALGLDFGAVDVIWNEKNRTAYVLEVNTAPGLEGQTVESYANAFRNWE